MPVTDAQSSNEIKRKEFQITDEPATNFLNIQIKKLEVKSIFLSQKIIPEKY